MNESVRDPGGRSKPAVSIQVKISPAELIDKLTILEIKRERVQESAKRPHVEFEYASLRSAYDQQIDASDALLALYRELREVNLQLWDIEDEIRHCEQRKDFGAAFAALARSVYVTNDR